MIKYALKCCNGHRFDSWFATAASFDEEAAQGRLACPACHAHQVSKAIMAPALVSRAADEPAQAVAADPPVDPAPLDEAAKARAAIRALHRYVRETSEDVGARFAEEARKIADGAAAERPIHGQASFEDAAALLREGLHVLPLPPLPDELN